MSWVGQVVTVALMRFCYDLLRLTPCSMTAIVPGYLLSAGDLSRAYEMISCSRIEGVARFLVKWVRFKV